jgi:hypothetical protein
LLSGQKIDDENGVYYENKSQPTNFLDLRTLAAMLNSSKVPPKQSSELHDHHLTKSSENIQVDQIDTSQELDQQANKQMSSLIQSFLNQSFGFNTNNVSTNFKQDTFNIDRNFENSRGKIFTYLTIIYYY